MTTEDKSQYIKVRREGGTTVLSVGKLIPKDWKIVRFVKFHHRNPDVVLVQIRKVA